MFLQKFFKVYDILFKALKNTLLIFLHKIKCQISYKKHKNLFELKILGISFSLLRISPSVVHKIEVKRNG